MELHTLDFFIGNLSGFTIGACITFLAYRSTKELLKQRLWDATSRLNEAEHLKSSAINETVTLKEALANASGQQMAEKKALESRIEALKEAEERFKMAFKVASSEALQANQETFSQFAKMHFEKWQFQAEQSLEKKNQAIGELVTPLKTALGQVETKVIDLEKAREGAYGSLTEQIKGLLNMQLRLEKETQTLSRAMGSAHVRGQWGELQLRRLVETAGMLPYVDFEEQVSLQAEGARLRPDMIIRLPNNRQIAIDAKVPLEAYIQASESTSTETQKIALARYTKHVRERILDLSSKTYWKQLEASPEFVILFLPAEPFLSAALTEDPTLLEWSSRQGVILATPSTLLALLKTIAYGWRQENMAQEALAISRLGKELHERLAILLEHWGDLQRALSKANMAYNKALSSLESRVIPTARRLEELHASTERSLPNLSALPINEFGLAPDHELTPETVLH